MSKKLISVLLAVVMVITAAFGTMTVSAEGDANCVGDGGFENANFSGTILNFGTGGATQTQTWGRFSSGVTRMELVTSDNYGPEDSVVLNGNQYMKSGVTAQGNYIRGFGQRIELTAGEYVFTFIAKSDVANTFNAGIYGSSIVAVAPFNAIVHTYLDATNYWKEYTLSFTIETDGIYNLIIGNSLNDYTNMHFFYLDNVAVYAKNTAVNINATSNAGGNVVGGGYVTKGSEVTLTATAKSGYKFAGWSDGETSATRTVTATADATYTAVFEKLVADFVPNGDFEADDWKLDDYWTVLSGNVAFTETADPANANNTVAYAEGNKAATSMISKNTITLKQGHTYVIEFDSYIVNSVSGGGTNFYRVGFVKPGSADLAGASFVASDYASVYNRTLSTELSTWKSFNYKYTHNAADTEANIALGMFNKECTSDWYIDNIVAYDEADVCTMSISAEKGGVVEGAKDLYFVGEELNLVATAKSGFEFAGWSDGVSEATRTVTASEGASYIAKFVKTSANMAINGDFEDDSWAVSEAWDIVNKDDKVFKKGTEANGNNYAYTIPSQRNSLASGVITIKPGEKYVLEFDSYFIDSGSEFKGDISGFYRYGFIGATQTDLSGAAFTSLTGNNYESFSPAAYQDDWFGTWHHKIATYTNTGDEDVQAKVVIGYFNEECGYEWRVDNVRLYNQANALNVAVSAENGTATASSATVLKGEKVTLTATPEKEEYEFLGWYANGVLVSNSEVYEVALTENATFTAKYKIVIPPVYNVVNGDFEANDNIDFATNITGSDNEGVWAKVGTGVDMFKVVSATDADPEFVGNAYALATAPAAGYVRTFGQFITLKANTDYTLEFAAKSNVVYMETSPVYGAVIKRMSGSHGITTGGGAANVISASSYVTISNDGEWHRYTVTFNSGNNTEVAVAFGGNATDTLMEGMYFAVDNVVLKESNVTTIGDFENGTAGWTTTGDATITTANTKETALSSFKKYLGEKVGVINPVNEGDTFTSPAFATEIGETYDVVIYTRHNSADDTRGKFMFTANGEKENLSQASYGVSQGESEEGRYENNDGFLVNPIPMGGSAKYQTSTFNKLILTFTATAESHNITITTVTPVSAFVDGFIVHSHSDAVELAENSIGYKGTAIRTTGVQGLRFKNSIAIDALAHAGNYAKVVEYGTLAIKEEYKDGEIIVENLTDGKYDYTKSSGKVGCRLKVGVAYNAVDGTDVVYTADLYNKDFTGVLIGINEEDYSSNYVTRVYAKVQFADGTYTYVYGDEQVANITAVAEHIVNNELETPEIRDYLNTNILGK